MRPAEHCWYKGKAAMRIKLIAPTEKKVSDDFTATTPGALLLELAPSAGTRKYNWENKNTIAISPQELAIIEYNRLAGKETKLFHDPNMKGEKQGQVTKSLYVKLTESNGFAFTLSVKANGKTNNVSIVLSQEEYFLFRELTLAAIPYLYAWT